MWGGGNYFKSLKKKKYTVVGGKFPGELKWGARVEFYQKNFAGRQDC